MAGLRELKNKRQSINKTRKVTRAMEMVSAVKMQKAQERALKGRAYATAALRILSHISGTIEASTHPLTQTHATGAVGLILITSDKGLAGALNSAVIKKAEAFLHGHKKEDIVCIAIGRRGHEFLRTRGYTILHAEENRTDTVSIDSLTALSTHALPRQIEGKTRSWHIAYMNFKSTFEQEPLVRQIFPLTLGTITDIITGIPSTKKAQQVAHAEDGKTPRTYTVEPSPQQVFDQIMPQLANVVLYHALLEAKASEHSARMVAMKSATDKAKELSHTLMLRFNKLRQAAITREVSEITSGIEAMK